MRHSMWLLAASVAVGCSAIKSDKPSREAALEGLKQEAQSLKTDGEKVDPSLDMKATWNIEGVDVREQPNDESRPWAGTIRFRIDTTMRDIVEHRNVTQSIQKKFDYVYDVGMKRWIIQYTPPTPAPAPS
jgi:hypothetical protein